MPSLQDKTQIHQAFIHALECLVENAEAATLRAYETATHEENIAENKYDTLGLEAAYLTQGQARRLEQCKADLAAFQHFSPKSFSDADAITVGALVQLEDENGNTQYLFMGPAAGGLKTTLLGMTVAVITPSAPLGQALLNAHAGDSICVHLANRPRTYDIIAIF